MKILLTGATGYIGKRLLPVLLEQGHEIICCVRDKDRFPAEGIYVHPNISLLEVDFLEDVPFPETIRDIEAAYYLIHSMSANSRDFGQLEATSAHNFIRLVKPTA